jgi:hypothetical protein
LTSIDTTLKTAAPAVGIDRITQTSSNNQLMKVFTEPETWRGGSVELLCAMGPSNAERRKRCVAAVWNWPSLRGPYARSDKEPSQQRLSQPNSTACHGVAALPEQLGEVAFKVSTVVDDDGLWLYAGVPMGSLGSVFPVGAFPFESTAVEPWERTVYGWLFGLAEHIAAQVPFERAVIGWITMAEVDQLSAQQVPATRFHGYIVGGESGFTYLPPNRTRELIT